MIDQENPLTAGHDPVPGDRLPARPSPTTDPGQDPTARAYREMFGPVDSGSRVDPR